ncbi:hypothetical protein E3P92_03784 [Wallemia ichthyophaga]|uniref:L-type lectin-like domain-containing protein n=1 Tax=Wallemia ichthyophaga TaxID=245174 RepID=A0A4T0G254_WALIC|nr:hypothetical protein E3P91_03807 [Wallemia ichthyophaga]TIA78596.1 hypothetical protein E3P98_03778 [Wallemia ichthyophaga]TIA95308.1 hypothetical protein E3P95_03776 [Wallemia ichthyophaga]TIA96266.1 hypothetical protein E3P94_03754 [Wallemia ichthyophaga]TIB00201.1 hypothetical protein E3P96_02707 [Wallemia ichthyophaga]
MKLFAGISFLAGLVLSATYKDSPGSRDVDVTTKLRTHSISAPYVDQELNNRWWDFGGSTIIDANNHIRLTQDKQSERGWIWSRLPITVSSYQVEFEFKVGGRNNHMYGDGFAMWLTQGRNKEGEVFGSVNNFYGLGVFFDTYANSRHSYPFPRISAMLGDGRTLYDTSTDGQDQSLDGCSLKFRKAEVTPKARFSYLKSKYIKLEVQTKKWGEWEECFMVEDVQLPLHPYLGFSSITGEIADNHDIISVDTNEIAERGVNHRAQEKMRNTKKAKSKTFFKTIVNFITYSFVLALFAVIAKIAHSVWKQKQAKRF